MSTNDNPTTGQEALDQLYSTTIASNPNATRAVLNQTEFFVRVLTEPQFISAHHASMLTHDHHIAPRGFTVEDDGSVTRQDGYDVRQVGGAEIHPKFTFMGRILRTTNGLRPHIYVRDPCTLSSTELSDTNYVNRLYSLHTQFISAEGFNGAPPTVGDIIKATIGRSDFIGPQLQVAYFDEMVSANDQELYMENTEQECHTLLNLLGVGSTEPTYDVCTQGGNEFDVVYSRPKNACRRSAESESYSRLNITGAPRASEGAEAHHFYDSESNVRFAASEGSYFHFFNEVLRAMGARYMSKNLIKKYQLRPRTITNISDFHRGECIKFLCAMAMHEMNQATNNPLSTTRNNSSDPSITAANVFADGGACVKNYSTFAFGVSATAATLNSSYYPKIQDFLKGRLRDSDNHLVVTARRAFIQPDIESELATFGGGSGNSYAAACQFIMQRRIEQAPTFYPGDAGYEDEDMLRGVNLSIPAYADRTRNALQACGFTESEITTYSGICAATAEAAQWRHDCSRSFTFRYRISTTTGTVTDDALSTTQIASLRALRFEKCLQHVGPNRGPIYDPIFQLGPTGRYTAEDAENHGFTFVSTSEDTFLEAYKGYGPNIYTFVRVRNEGAATSYYDYMHTTTSEDITLRRDFLEFASGQYREIDPSMTPGASQAVAAGGETFAFYHARPAAISIEAIQEFDSEVYLGEESTASGVTSWSYGSEKWRHYVGDWAPGAFVGVIENAMSQQSARYNSVNFRDHHHEGHPPRGFLSRGGQHQSADECTVEGATFNGDFRTGTTE